MPLFDFHCTKCEEVFEAIVKSDAPPPPCGVCGAAETHKRPSGFAVMTTIVPTTKTSKKYKAGYVHSHGNRPATPGKIQVGYTGSGKRED